MSDHPKDPTALLRKLSAAQHGVVARRQLIRAGIRAHWVEYQVRRRRVRCLHRGVYGVGPAPLQHEREMAAVLACGAGAVLGHHSATAALGITPPNRADDVDVVSERGFRAPGSGIRVHRVRRLHPDEITDLHGMPITTPARTLLDIAADVDANELERCVAHALRQRLVTREQLDVLLARHRRRPGTRKLRMLLARLEEPALTRSAAEKLGLILIRKAGLERPETNVMLEGFEVDFLWRAHRLVMEVDGFAFHSSPEEFERDRQRDAVLTAAGYRVIRVTWRQLTREQLAVAARLGKVLARSAVAGPGSA